MKTYKCGMPHCSEYISEDELIRVRYNNKLIDICMTCDDGSLDFVTGGEHHDTIEKIEKIRRNRYQKDQ